MKKKILLSLPSIFFCLTIFAQPSRWQQKVKYNMDVTVNVNTNRINGKQKLEYTNNSPDTLRKVFYHLYWNAFQPNSMMDVRSRELGKQQINGRPDWDARVTDRISKLSESEIGYQKISSLMMDGVKQNYKVHETILEVVLSRPILPGAKVNFDMEFESQVPVQIRRAGRDAANGIRYSMSQWYPKMAEYDYDGWHPNPYIAREFYGVWGNYDVKITIDKSYILGGTGYLQNPQQVGYGYEKAGTKVSRPGTTLTWHFVAPNVHDFMWAADPDFKHIRKSVPGGPEIHVLYNGSREDLQQQFDRLRPADQSRFGNLDGYIKNQEAQWNEIAEAALVVFPYVNKTFGEYPYKQYSFIHGGDGGMEYPMATLLAGPSLGTAFHELMHSWYQMILGTNESLYAWMDEGFTEWSTNHVQKYYRDQVLRKREGNDAATLARYDSLDKRLPLLHSGNYNSYLYLAKSGLEEPLTTHADHFNTNMAHSLAAYSKGSVFLSQLGYITGDQNLYSIMKEYFRLWKFKHPNANDFLRVAEKVSGLQLDWYKEYWVNSTKTIDYGIDSLWEEGGKTKIRLKRIGKMPMPIDFKIEYKDGSSEIAYIPQYLMFGEKPAEDETKRTVYEAWKWTHPTYTFEVDRRLRDMKLLEIDPSLRMADLERRNNRLEIPL